MNISSAQTARGNIHYRERPGNRPILLFLHGNLGSSRWWEPVLARLPAGWRGIAYDAIGYGASDRPEGLERYSVPARLRDLIAFTEALGLDRVHLIAHSTATPAAMEYALMAPERVITLTLIGAVPATGVQTPQEAYPLLERMTSEPDMLAEMLKASAPHLDADGPEFARYLADAASLAPLTLPAIARGLDAWKPGDRLRHLTLPVMLVRGEEDIMLEEQDAYHTLLAIPGAGNLEIMHGAGHSPMIETPDGLAELLIAFIAEDWDDYESIRQSVT
jgi:pimeloyl-ACP methyl ester carboxylesterase